MSVGSTMPCKWDSPISTAQITSYKMERPAYSTLPPVENIPANNECRMVEVRGSQVASFILGCEEYICLPQAFDLFLKHLVGGLHTVYTKLKRLNITPVVCNVEQVRILRGLGAIQPGVNRCKLITRKDFEILYQDCTTASRPGRPPKRYPVLPPTTELMSHHASLRNNSALLNSDLSAFQKRMRLDQPNERRASGSPTKDNEKPLGSFPGLPSDLHTNPGANLAYLQQAIRQQYQQAAVSGFHNGLDSQQINPALAPLMMMSHPALFASGLPPNSMAMLNHLNQIAHSNAASGAMTSAAAAAAAAAQLAANGGKTNPGVGQSSIQNTGSSRSPSNDKDSDVEDMHTTPSCYNHAMRLSNGMGSDGRTSPASSIGSIHDGAAGHLSDSNGHAFPQTFKDSGLVTISNTNGLVEAAKNFSKIPKAAPPSDDEIKALEHSSKNVSSMQSLLTNIQGLLKVAADNASLQEKHSSFEIADLKHKLSQERQLREVTEMKLNECEKERAEAEKRFNRERKEAKKLQSRLVTMQQLLTHDINNNNHAHDGDVEIMSPRSSPTSTNGVHVSDPHSDEASSPPVTVTSPLSLFDANAFSAHIAAAALVSQQAGNKPPSPSSSPNTPTSSIGTNQNANNNNPSCDDRTSPDFPGRSVVSDSHMADLAIDLGRPRSKLSSMQDSQRLFFSNQNMLFQQQTASQ